MPIMDDFKIPDVVATLGVSLIISLLGALRIIWRSWRVLSVLCLYLGLFLYLMKLLLVDDTNNIITRQSPVPKLPKSPRLQTFLRDHQFVLNATLRLVPSPIRVRSSRYSSFF